MQPFLDASGFTHVIALLLLAGRLGDILSTRIVTPSLSLETNSIARRLGWRFAWATLLAAIIPYYSLPVGIALVSGSFLVAASNFSRAWMYRALGEAATEELLLRAIARSTQRTAISLVLVSAAFLVGAGLTLMWLSVTPERATYWFGFGIGAYGLVTAVHGSLFLRRLFRRVHIAAAAA